MAKEKIASGTLISADYTPYQALLRIVSPKGLIKDGAFDKALDENVAIYVEVIDDE